MSRLAPSFVAAARIYKRHQHAHTQHHAPLLLACQHAAFDLPSLEHSFALAMLSVEVGGSKLGAPESAAGGQKRGWREGAAGQS